MTGRWNECRAVLVHRFVRVVRSAGLVKRARFAVWLGLAAALLLLAAPGISLAATADLQVTTYSDFSTSATFTYSAASGEANDLVVDVSQKGGLLTVTATDRGAAISPGSRCAATAVNSVACSYQGTSPGTGTFFYVPTSMVVGLGDRDDSSLFPTPTFGGMPGVEDALNVDYRVDGGTGDDRVTVAGPQPLVNSELRGGPGNDVLQHGNVLDGGGGRDELHGFPYSRLTDGDTEGSVDADILDGGGNGQVDYSSRTRPLHVDLGDGAPDGEVGEGDRITGVTNVIGGRANDFLAGTAANDTLEGGPGNDRIYGRGLHDSIGVNGSDRAFGGHGDDSFERAAGPGSFQPTIDCGPGRDSSMGASSGPGPWLSRTCELVRDNDAEDVVLAAPTHPVAASSSGRLVFQVSQTCEPSKYRLTLTSARQPPRRIVTRNFETKAGRCKISRRFALKLPQRVARQARRRAIHLRERVDLDIGEAGRYSLVWRFDLRLPRP